MTRAGKTTISAVVLMIGAQQCLAADLFQDTPSAPAAAGDKIEAAVRNAERELAAVDANRSGHR
ncbi:MAG TPA: hypothetical protein VGR19_06580 [Allosphingosinicella sp.]|nr:hypothetical protein [Allosphingosinicella sp.]